MPSWKCPIDCPPGRRPRPERPQPRDRAFTLDLMAAIISFTIGEDDDGGDDDEDVDDDNAGRDSLFSLTERRRRRRRQLISSV